MIQVQRESLDMFQHQFWIKPDTKDYLVMKEMTVSKGPLEITANLAIEELKEIPVLEVLKFINSENNFLTFIFYKVFLVK